MSKPHELKKAMEGIKPVLCTQFMCECIDQWFDEWKDTQNARGVTGEIRRIEGEESGCNTEATFVHYGQRETCAA